MVQEKKQMARTAPSTCRQRLGKAFVMYRRSTVRVLYPSENLLAVCPAPSQRRVAAQKLSIDARRDTKSKRIAMDIRG